MADKITSLNFDASQYKPMDDFSTPIPKGWYNAEIVDAEVLATKGAAGGTRVKIAWRVIDGEYKGRMFFSSINNKNKNKEAEEIGNRELSSVAHATGVINFGDLKQLIGKVASVRLAIKPESGEYDESNVPKAYKQYVPAGGAVGGFQGPAQFPGQAPGGFPGQQFPGAAPQGFPQQQGFPGAAAPAGAFGQAPGGFDPNAGQFPGQAQPGFAPQGFPGQQAAPAPFQQPAPAFQPPAPQFAAPAPQWAPPAGWAPNPQQPGTFYNAQGQVATQEQLMAAFPAPAALAPQPQFQQPAPQGFPQGAPQGFPGQQAPQGFPAAGGAPPFPQTGIAGEGPAPWEPGGSAFPG